MKKIKIKTVRGLKRALEHVNEDIPVNLMVNYDNCWHMQEMGSICVVYNTDTNELCILIGAKDDEDE